MKKTWGMFVAILVLFSLIAVPVAKPVAAAEDDKVLKTVIYSSTGALFMGVWNPSSSGYSDTYSRRISDLVFDYGFPYGVEGVPVPYHCRVVEYKKDVTVPNDAVIFNSTTDTWVAAHAGETAATYAKIECDRPYFHDGHKLSAADVMYSFAWEWEWINQDGDDDPYYDPSEADWAGDFMNTILGIKFVEQTDDRMVFEIYHNYFFPASEIMTAAYVVPFTGTPWQLWYAMSELVAHNEKYSWSESTEEIEQLDQINPNHAQAIKEKLLELKNTKPIPEFLKPYIDDENAAKATYDSIASFIDKYGHAVIGQGPYYVEEYQPENLYVRLKKFDKWTIPAFAEDKYKVEPYFETIEVYGLQNPDTAILEVAKGTYDILWYPFPAYKFTGLSQEQKNAIDLYKSTSAFGDLVFNPVHDPDNPYVITVGDKKYFNPFAVRKVRFGLQYLISRAHIAQNIFQGSAGAMYTPWVSSETGYEYVQPVVEAYDLSEQPDEAFALKLIEEGMQEAAQELAKMGYKLEKIDGKWYFEGEPVKIIGLGRTEDERKDIALYVANEILPKAGFEAEANIVDRRTASGMVYTSDPSSYQWNFYTEGWVSSSNVKFSISRIIQYYSSIWYAPGLVGWKWTPENTKRATLEEVLKYLGDGDIAAGLSKLGLDYYTTVDKIQPLLNWTADDFAIVIYSGENKGVKMDSEDKYWDFNRLGAAIGIYESFRVFLYENWEFYAVNKRVKIELVDPVAGLAASWSLRSAKPAVEPTTTTTTTTQTTTTTTSQTTQTTTTTTQTTETETTTEEGGICGPAALVGLALIPLLLRKRK
ncbi:ABC transporter substrate-binding protein [Thermococcus aggregans]|uniref:ABC transporter substrate-binding protein n=1 Tax=Thermococcus aggregans TaxID=110163 RepID=A0A9E7SMC1_THEAG|nr:ABC transporter substrate-binding protein [Thermococcus aggregans]USS39893.1 ABC transporter substrate-binding protein [Thermococcus aggregans]